MKDAGNRELAKTDLKTSYLVEAAAGTGKTTLLTDRLLNIVKSGVLLTEVAAITFTEKAAGELKDRLRKKLPAEALDDLERAQVSTIHSFCAWLLKERPVEAGVDPQFQVADPLQADLLCEEAWAGWFAREAATDGDERAPLRRLLAVNVTPDTLWSLAKFVVENRHRIEDAPARPPVRPVGKVLDEISALVSEIDNLRAKANGSDKFAEAIEQWMDRLVLIESLPAWEVEALVLTAPSLLTELKGQKWKPHDLFVAAKTVGEQIEQRRSELMDALLRDALDWLKSFLAQYDALKRQRVMLDFDDLLARARDLLAGHADVRKELQQRFRYLLVDEFQDTDPVQMEIIRLLAGEVPGKLFVVGDPKQSIYAFRGADIELYQAVAKKMEVLTIQTNFRSRSKLLEWVNAVFQRVIQIPADGDYQPRYVALEPKELTCEPGVLQLLPAAEFEKKDEARVAEADAIAKCLCHLHATKSWKDMAMLLCTTTALETFLDALRRYEVPYRVIGGKDFYVRQEIQKLASLLICLDNPADKLHLVAVLRSPLFGWTDEEIFLAHRANALDDLAGNEVLRSLHTRRHEYSVAGYVQAAMSETKMCEAFHTKADGESCVLNLLKALELARALEAAGLRSLRAFARRLRRSVLDEFEEEPSPAAEEDDDVVRIMTVHRAKGLEFDVVVLADLCGESRDTGASYIDGELRFNKLTTSGFAAANARQRLRETAEEIRLLYVAATRAKELLVLPWFVPEGKPGRSRHLVFEDVPPGCMTTMKADALQATPAAQAPLRVSFDAKMSAAKLIAQRREWFKAQADLRARASQPAARARPSKLAEHEAEPTGVEREAAMSLGVTVHDALERMDANGLTGRALELVERALKSDLLARAGRAEICYREMPFSLVGMDGKLDLLFCERGRWVLVDYKTDARPDAESYRTQLQAYADALNQIAGIKVEEKLLYFLATGETVRL